MNSGLAIIGLALLLVAAVSRRLSSTPVTPAMVVTAIGVLVGPLVLDDLSVRPTSSTVRTLAEATLAVVLFSDSSRVVVEEIGYGLLGGVAAGVLAAVVVNVAEGRHLIDDAWRQIIPVAAAVLAYGIAVDLGGSGFIAAFVAGSLFGLIARENLASMMRFTEETGAALDTVTFLVFGAVLLGPVLEHVSWQIALYAVLSLTIVRMLSVAISLWGTHALGPTVAVMGGSGHAGSHQSCSR